jgi:hypothetical protein
MFPEIPVIGGPADGRTMRTTSPAVVTIPIAGHQYIKIEFKDSAQGKRYLYMAAGMAPIEAVKLWRERYEKDVKTPEK